MNLNKIAASATLHCLTGCAIGEVLGMIISTVAGWTNLANIVLSIILAFIFGYAFSVQPLLNALSFNQALRVAFAADTASIATMELADNGFIIAVPGALDASVTTWLFWISLITSLAVAYIVAFPLNRWLISRGKGHALAHNMHAAHDNDHSHHH